jgi:hypothetical protein
MENRTHPALSTIEIVTNIFSFINDAPFTNGRQSDFTESVFPVCREWSNIAVPQLWTSCKVNSDSIVRLVESLESDGLYPYGTYIRHLDAGTVRRDDASIWERLFKKIGNQLEGICVHGDALQAIYEAAPLERFNITTVRVCNRPIPPALLNALLDKCTAIRELEIEFDEWEVWQVLGRYARSNWVIALTYSPRPEEYLPLVGTRDLARSIHELVLKISDTPQTDTSYVVDRLISCLSAYLDDDTWQIKKLAFGRYVEPQTPTLLRMATKCSDIRLLSIDGCTNFDDEALAIFARASPRLNNLKFSTCTSLTLSSMSFIADNFANLRKLVLNDCPNISLNDLVPVLERCTYLEFLAATGISGSLTAREGNGQGTSWDGLRLMYLIRCDDVNDDTLAQVASHAPNIFLLRLESSQGITGRGLDLLADNCRELRVLEITKCHNVTRSDVEGFHEKIQVIGATVDEVADNDLIVWHAPGS